MEIPDNFFANYCCGSFSNFEIFLLHKQIIGNCYLFQISQIIHSSCIIILRNFIFSNRCSGWYFCKSLFWMIFLQIVLINQFFLQILVVDNLFANFKKCCSQQLFCKIAVPDKFFLSFADCRSQQHFCKLLFRTLFLQIVVPTFSENPKWAAHLKSI